MSLYVFQTSCGHPHDILFLYRDTRTRFGQGSFVAMKPRGGVIEYWRVDGVFAIDLIWGEDVSSDYISKSCS